MNMNNPYEENLQKPLEKYGRDITKAAKDGKIDPVIGRDDEIRSITRILSRKTKNNPVLIGEPGVGKTAIVEGLATRIIKGDVPNSLKNKSIWELDINSLRNISLLVYILFIIKSNILLLSVLNCLFFILSFSFVFTSIILTLF